MGFITPGIAGFHKSVELVTMVVVGGMASIWGSVFGAALLSLLPEFLAKFEGFETIAFGVILVATMIFLPRGIVPSLVARLMKKGA
jgi:branched-chain amino acid transport system permease protein